MLGMIDFPIRIVLVTIAIVLILFLLCRELVCWYFKINERVRLLREIRDQLKGREITQADRVIAAITR